MNRRVAMDFLSSTLSQKMRRKGLKEEWNRRCYIEFSVAFRCGDERVQ